MSLIPSDNSLLVWAAIIVIMACAVAMDQKWKWASKINSCTLCILGGLLFANLKVIPMKSPVYDAVGNYVLILAIPLLLFKSDLRKIYKESGQSFLLFHVCAVGATIAAFIGAFVCSSFDGIRSFAAAYCGGAIGGTVNIVALSKIFGMDDNMLSSLLMVANFTAVSLLFIFSQMSHMSVMQRNFRHPYMDAYYAQISEEDLASGKSQSALFWKRKDVSLLDMAKALATTFAIVGVSQVICGVVNAAAVPSLIRQLFGNIFLMITLVTVIAATSFPKYFNNIGGSDEIGNVMMLIWFVTIGCGCDIAPIIKYGALTLIFFAISFVVMSLITFTVGRFFKISMEEIMACIIAAIGGPPTAAALAISNGWNALIVPGMLVGIYGYIIGNYFGVFVGNMLGGM